MAPATRASGADPRIPVTILTGFLGAGKTTLLNRVLKERHGKKYAIIENEYGSVGVDDALVAARMDTDEAELVEVLNGCICCTVRGDLVRALHRLLDRPAAPRGSAGGGSPGGLGGPAPLDGIIIETTGLADPAPVAQSVLVDARCSDALRLDAIVTVVDAKHVLTHLDDTARTPGAENEVAEQLAFADRILLNKVDLVRDRADLENVRARVRAINGHAPVLECVQSAVPVDQVLGLRAFDVRRILEGEPGFLDVGDPAAPDAGHVHDDTVTSVGIQAEGDLDEGRLNAWLSELLAAKGADLFRSKGVLALAGSDAKFVFQGVHMMLQLGSSGEGAAAGGWAPGECRVNRLVFIGRNLDRDALTASFTACLAAGAA